MKIRGAGVLVLLLTGIGAVAWVMWSTDATPRDVLSTGTLIGHSAAFLLFGLDLLCRSARLSLLFGVVGTPVRLWDSARIQVLGETAGAVTPGRTGSEPARLAEAHHMGIGLSPALAATGAELLVEVFTLAPFVLVLWAVLQLPGAVVGATMVYCLGTIGGAVVLVWVATGSYDRIPPRRLWGLCRLKPRYWRVLRVGARRFTQHLSMLRNIRMPTLLFIVFLTMVRISSRLAVLPVFVLTRSPGTPLEPLVGWPLLLLYAGSILPVPGGGGAVEAGFGAALQSTLSESELAGSLLWWRWYTFYLGVALGSPILLGTLEKFRSRKTASRVAEVATG